MAASSAGDYPVSLRRDRDFRSPNDMQTALVWSTEPLSATKTSTSVFRDHVWGQTRWSDLGQGVALSRVYSEHNVTVWVFGAFEPVKVGDPRVIRTFESVSGAVIHAVGWHEY